ncbi:hypothetical protein D0860_07065 [Hortaea werneckii]|uniref:Peptide hydrolase n=1 Tax=Hortaea werneckii TaxID=91943 RepID=A0A3M7GQ29_HORWE|nr:hypothetical protein D0860_07065 [Hortaea werneckii]
MRASQFLALPALLRSAVLAYTPLGSDSLAALHPATEADFNSDDGDLLAPILIPRVPGSAGSDAVLNHFVNFFTTQLPDWKLSWQNSTSTTPTSNGKEIPFRNLIATRDPPWLEDQAGEVGRLALVAHYDSKITPEGFIGATDSAAPCAMLLYAARALNDALTAKWASDQPNSSDDLDAEPKGIQILLLDGEEAFKSWTDTDSLYGARSLASEWETTPNPATATYRTPLHSIDLFVLLDLLGAASPSVPSYFKTTHWAYQQMADIESRLRGSDLLHSKDLQHPFLPEPSKKDTDRWIGGYVEDDHVPFMARGVEILHLIPSPFPGVWHTMDDDGAHLDLDTVRDWAVITAGFAAEWLDLEGFLGEKEKEGGVEGGKEAEGKSEESRKRGGRDEL